jgi:hypothetical protein
MPYKYSLIRVISIKTNTDFSQGNIFIISTRLYTIITLKNVGMTVMLKVI